MGDPDIEEGLRILREQLESVSRGEFEAPPRLVRLLEAAEAALAGQPPPSD